MARWAGAWLLAGALAGFLPLMARAQAIADDRPLSEAEPADLAEHHKHNQLHSQLNQQLRAAQAQSSLATAGRDAVPLMRATHPSADGHTRF